MKALRRSFLCSNSKEYAIFANGLELLANLFAERSYMGLQCQAQINMDTQKFLTFTVGDGHSANVDLNFLCLNKVFGIFF